MSSSRCHFLYVDSEGIVSVDFAMRQPLFYLKMNMTVPAVLAQNI
jgi:hypothetical protein